MDKQVDAYICATGHVVLVKQNVCPVCGGSLLARKHPTEATLTSQTTVRVSPTGSQFRLGIARLAAGGSTLCRIDDDVANEIGVLVSLVIRDGIFYATPHRTSS